jgi:hypothetical protein
MIAARKLQVYISFLVTVLAFMIYMRIKRFLDFCEAGDNNAFFKKYSF